MKGNQTERGSRSPTIIPQGGSWRVKRTKNQRKNTQAEKEQNKDLESHSTRKRNKKDVEYRSPRMVFNVGGEDPKVSRKK